MPIHKTKDVGKLNLSRWTLALFVAFSLLISACSSGDEAQPPSSTSNGAPAVAEPQEVPGHSQLFAQSGCVACHSVSRETKGMLGPSLAGLVPRSTETVNDLAYTGSAETVEAYIRESILQPQVYVVPGYPSVMPQTYEASLSENELTQLVDYLLTLK